MTLQRNNVSSESLAIIGSRSLLVAGVFCSIALATIVSDYVQLVRLDPIDSIRLAQLKQCIATRPSYEPAKQEIRLLDQQVRRQYIGYRTRIDRGRYLLLGGLIAMLACGALVAAARRRPPLPSKVQDSNRSGLREARMTQTATALLAIVLLGGGLSLVRNVTPPPWMKGPNGQSTSQAQSSLAEAASLPSEEEYSRSWPRLFGPTGLCVSAAKNVPFEWDAASGRNILWKMPVELPGMNSPIVWGNRVFLTGATKTERRVYCFDSETGKLLWERLVTPGRQWPVDATEPMDDTGYAAPTGATDGLRVYSLFANGDLVAFDFNGRQVWLKSLGCPSNQYGHASSLLTHRNLLIVQYDQGSAEENLSRIVALDGATGVEVWKKDRPVNESWTTPVVIHADEKAQLITAANPLTIAYDPMNGKELWRAEVLSGDVAPSPAFDGERVIVTTKHSVLAAIGASGEGAGKIIWTVEEDAAPDICTPICYEGMILLVDSTGTLTAFESRDGKRLWQENIFQPTSASPIIADGRLYLFDRQGKASMLKVSRQYEQMGQCDIGEECHSSPAIIDGRIYIRGIKHLYCIGTAK